VKAVINRLRKLELGFGFTAAVPSVDEAIIGRLVAGEWQSALKLLEPQEQNVWQEQQPIGRSGRGPTGRIDFALTGLTRMRQGLSVCSQTCRQSGDSISPSNCSRPTSTTNYSKQQPPQSTAATLRADAGVEAGIASVPLAGAGNRSLARERGVRPRGQREPGGDDG
jgi:hypothetical protein